MDSILDFLFEYLLLALPERDKYFNRTVAPAVDFESNLEKLLAVIVLLIIFSEFCEYEDFSKFKII